MKYVATRTFGPYRAGHEYEIGRLSVTDRNAVRVGLLVAAEGWCAPSQSVYSDVPVIGDGLLPELQMKRGGVKFPENTEQPVEKPVKRAAKPRKKAVVPDTLESLAETISEALDGLRG